MTGNIDQLQPGDDEGFAEMVAIYPEAIEPSEQKAPTELAKLLRDPRYVFLVARTGGNITAFAIMFFPRSGGFWLLEYMAVDKTLRSRGQGEEIFRGARAVAQSRSPGLACVLEVDQPGADANTLRRLRFYKRVRCRVISGLNYILPLDVAGVPPPMMLLIHGLDDASSIDRETVRDWVTALYTDVYQRAPSDPRIAAMVSRLPDQLSLEMLPD